MVFKKQIKTEATLTCPECGEKQKVSMPTDACQHFYKCESCGKLLSPKKGDCCVFCSFADSKCPPKQQEALKLFIPVLEGTTRVQRKSILVARFVMEVGKTYNEVETMLVDPNDFDFLGDGNDPEGKDPRYTEIVERADGFFIVTPEYNHSIPGSLKRMLDSELKLYNHKPVAFAGVSSGMFGGARAIEALVTTVREMGMVATHTDVHFPKVGDLFDEKGKIKDEESYTRRVKRSWDELLWMARVLKTARDGDKS